MEKVETEQKMPEHGDHKLYRCEIRGCERVYLHEDVARGGCPHCGGRRVRFATALTDAEGEYLKQMGYDLAVNGWEQHD